MYTLDEFIARLQCLREVTGGDAPVALYKGDGVLVDAAVEQANARLLHEVGDYRIWMEEGGKGSKSVVSIY